MEQDYGLKLAQEMYPNVRPLKWPTNQPICEIHKDSDGKYSVFLFGVTSTYVTKGVLRVIDRNENWYAYNAERMDSPALFDTLYDAEFAYLSYCKRNERKIGKERLYEKLFFYNKRIGVVKKYYSHYITAY